MHSSPRREAAAKYTGRAGILLAGLLGVLSIFQSCQPAYAQAVCVVSGTVIDGGAQPVVGTQVRFRVVSPVLATTGAGIASQDLTAITTAGGAWSLTLLQGLNAQVDIPAIGISKDTVIPSGASCPALFSALTLYNRGTLTPATILSTTGPSMGGDLTGSSPNPTVVGLRGQTLAVGNCTNGQARVYSSGSSSYTCQTVTTGTGLTGLTGGTGITISGAAPTLTVGVTSGAITNTQLGTGAAAANLGAAGGALSGTYPAPALAAGVAATNVGALGGDLSGTLPSPTVATVGAQTAANVAAGAVLANAATSANTPSTIVKRDGSNNFTAGTITAALAGNATTATTLSSSLTGDASSSGNAVTVTGLRGRPVNAAAPTTGYALTWSGTDWAPAASVGTVTSVSASGGGTGMSFSGSPVTGAGTLTLQGTLGIGFGGTGQTSAAAGFDALSPMTALGDTLYGGASGTRTRLAGNTTTTNQFLRSTGSAGLATAPQWAALVAADIPASITSNTSGTAAGLSATLAVGSGGTGQTTTSGAFNALSPTTTTGDLIYANGAGTNARLAGNITTTKNFLVQTGNGATSNAPSWGTIVSGDLPATIAANTSGSAASLSATLGVATGGSGATTFSAGVLHSPGGTAAFTSSPVALATEVSGQLPIGNGGTGQATAAAAYNALAPTTTAGDFAYANGAGTNTRLAGNATGTKMFMQETSSVPSWAALVAADIPNLDASKITTGAFGIAQLPSLAGDTTGTITANTNIKLQGRAVANSAPSDLQYLGWNQGLTQWEPKTLPNGSVTSVAASGGTTGFSFTGSPITSSGTLTLTGTLAVANGGTGQTTAAAAFNSLAPTTTLGDLIYASGAATNTRLGGNTTTTPKYLRQVGDGVNSAAPTWTQPAISELSGTATVSQGGTGAGTLTGLLRGNGTSAITGGALVNLATEVTGTLSPSNLGSGIVKADGSVPITANWAASTVAHASGLTPSYILSRNSTTFFNVIAYGADPTGTTDSTADINKAISDCLAGGGGTVYFPQGHYKVNTTITIGAFGTITRGLTLKGDNGTYAGPGAYGGSTLVWNGTPGTPMLWVKNFQHLVIDGLGMDGANIATSTAILIDNDGTAGTPTKNNSIRDLCIRRFLHGIAIGTLVGGGASVGQIDSLYVENVVITEAADLATTNTGVAVFINNSNFAYSRFKGMTIIGYRYAFQQKSFGSYTIDSCTGGNPGGQTMDFWYTAGNHGTVALDNSECESIGAGHFIFVDSTATANLNNPITIRNSNVTVSQISQATRLLTEGCQITGAITFASAASVYNSRNDALNGGSIVVGASGTLYSRISDTIAVGTTAAVAPLEIAAPRSSLNVSGIPIAFTDTTALAANTGGGLTLRGIYTAGGSITEFATIAAQKDNATTGNFGASLNFYNRCNGAGTWIAGNVGGPCNSGPTMTLGSTGNVGVQNPAPAYTTDIGQASSAGATLNVNGAVQSTSANGAQWISGQSSELLVLNTGGTTTDTSANLLPANSIIRSVVVRVTAAITTATAFSVGDATIAARFLATGTGLTIGSTGVGLAHVDQTGTSGPRQTAAAKVRVTTTGTPSAGTVRITVFYEQFVAPTS